MNYYYTRTPGLNATSTPFGCDARTTPESMCGSCSKAVRERAIWAAYSNSMSAKTSLRSTLPPNLTQRSCKCHRAVFHNKEPARPGPRDPPSPHTCEIAMTAARASDDEVVEKSNVRSSVWIVKHSRASAGNPCFLKFGEPSLRHPVVVLSCSRHGGSGPVKITRQCT